MSELDKLLTDVTKYRKNPQDSAEYLINYYYNHFYKGTELDRVTLIYFEDIFMELFLWLAENERYLDSLNKNNMNKIYMFFDKAIVRAKIRSHKSRTKLFHNWLGGKDNLKSDDLTFKELDILATLFLLYPDIDDIKDVKTALGLDENREQLNKKLKELNNVKRV